LMEIPAERAQSGDSALQVFDTILCLNQDEVQAGLANVSIGGGPSDDSASVHDEGDEVDDGLECFLKKLGAESCRVPFANAVDLAKHLVLVHEMDPRIVRDNVQEAEIALRARLARKS
jgi:hypothetical protein